MCRGAGPRCLTLQQGPDIDAHESPCVRHDVGASDASWYVDALGVGACGRRYVDAFGVIRCAGPGEPPCLNVTPDAVPTAVGVALIRRLSADLHAFTIVAWGSPFGRYALLLNPEHCTRALASRHHYERDHVARDVSHPGLCETAGLVRYTSRREGRVVRPTNSQTCE